MKLTMIYKAKDFWGKTIERRDEINFASSKHLSACFRNLKANYDSAIHVNEYFGSETISLFWDSLSSQENGILTIRIYDSWNSYDEKRMAFDKAKVFIRNRIGE